MTTPQDIIAACEAEWDAHKSDCSGFVKAVAARFGVVLTGPADAIVDQIKLPPWTLQAGGPAAAACAANGQLVVAGLKGADQVKPDPHGHVVIVVKGPLARGAYPTAYWGRLGGVGAKAQTTNFAWQEVDRDKVIYSAIDV